jgi:hypothetical protein
MMPTPFSSRRGILMNRNKAVARKLSVAPSSHLVVAPRVESGTHTIKMPVGFEPPLIVNPDGSYDIEGTLAKFEEKLTEAKASVWRVDIMDDCYGVRPFGQSLDTMGLEEHRARVLFLIAAERVGTPEDEMFGRSVLMYRGDELVERYDAKPRKQGG